MIKCGHCGEGHGSVADVKACAKSSVLVIDRGESACPYDAMGPDGSSMSAGLERVRCLLAEREVEPRYAQHLRIWVDSSPSNITQFGIRTAIARLEAFPAKRAGGPPERDGIFRTPDGRVWKVVWNKAAGNGRYLYAKVWKGERYQYAAGGMKLLKEADRLTRAQAQELGRDQNSPLYGHCANCGADLTDEDSIERAMGPDCYAKKGYWAE